MASSAASSRRVADLDLDADRDHRLRDGRNRHRAGEAALSCAPWLDAGAHSSSRDVMRQIVERGDDVAVTSFLDVIEGLAASPNDEVRNLIGIIVLEDGVLLSGGREHAALTSLVPRFGPATQALLAETKRHYDALVEASRR